MKLELSNQESLFIENVNSKIKEVIHSHSEELLKQIINEHFSHPGKMLRPKMMAGLGESLGISIPTLECWAASCEILHNATLIHDDLQDGDEYRRGQPTTWKKYGEAQAINAGDLLFLAAHQPLLKSAATPELKINLISLFSEMACEIVNGQCLEFLFKDLSDLPNIEKNYLRCIQAKTAALFAKSAMGVSLIGGFDKNFQKKIFTIFDQIGKIFQIQDDILDLYGDKQRESKGCDLKEGKISFLIITHLKYNPEDLDIIKKVLLKDRDLTSLEDIAVIETLFAQKKTLAKSTEALSCMIADVINDPWLIPYPSLKKYIDQILKKILEPVNSIL